MSLNFKYLAKQVGEHISSGEPVISVDTKKKELVGNYDNGGSEWQPGGEPQNVNDHDFPDKEFGKAMPYGVYDVEATPAGSLLATMPTLQHLQSTRLPHGGTTLDPWSIQMQNVYASLLMAGVKQFAIKTVETRTGSIFRTDWFDDHGLSLPTRNKQMEQDRTPSLQSHHYELARTTAC